MSTMPDDRPDDETMARIAAAAARSTVGALGHTGAATAALLGAALNVARNHGISDEEVTRCLRGLIDDNPVRKRHLQ